MLLLDPEVRHGDRQPVQEANHVLVIEVLFPAAQGTDCLALRAALELGDPALQEPELAEELLA
jgi:hypothetical protein